MSSTVISVQDVSKRFVIRQEKSLKERVVNFGRSNKHKQDFWALRDISLDIEVGSSVGLVGPNGSGKSTLLKTIGGIIQPTTGSVSLRGRLAALLELGAGFHPDLTGRENVYLNASILGLSRKQTDLYFDAIVDFSGIEPFIDTQVKFYSSGMYVRLAFAVAVHVDPDILLVDEVLAVGDEPFQRKCMEKIRGFQHDGRTIVFVSHSLDQVADLCDRAIVLESGRIRADGEPREALRVLRDDFEEARQADITRAQERAEAAAAAAAEAVAAGDGSEEPVEVPGVPAVAPPPRARIVGVTATTPEGAGEMRPGEDVVVRVRVQADQPLEDWVLGFGIDTPLGQSVFGTNTRLLDLRLPRVVGPATFEFRLPALALGEGSYTVHGAIAAKSGLEIHRLVEGARLVVVADGRTVGQIHVDVDFTGQVEQVAEQRVSA
ncbi:MAG TPA: ABC transporter ATP-binding protein [Cellulomonas sp.]